MDKHYGLQHDVALIAARIKERRRALTWLLSSGAAAVLAACGGGDGNDESAASSASSSSSSDGSSSSGSSQSTTTSCIADPEETNGPYPADGSNTVNGMSANVLSQSGIVRSDIRSSFGSSTTTAEGVPLSLTLTIVNSNNSCAVLSGYAVYIWHCDRGGDYSLYSSSIRDENYLRGVQVTDANGQLTFQTIFPGCYSGRYPHIHFEVYPSLAMATLYTNALLTSQMAMPQDASSAVYNNASGYSQSITNLSRVSVSSDGVFGDNTAAQIAQMTPTLSGSVAAGYTGTILIGVPV